MLAINVSGWMADFGESLPLDAALYSGEDPSVVHSKYPDMWAELNQKAVWSHRQKTSQHTLWNVSTSGNCEHCESGTVFSAGGGSAAGGGIAAGGGSAAGGTAYCTLAVLSDMCRTAT